MATSGTVGTTVVNVATLIDHAFRRCGVLPAQQTPEMVKAAKEMLWMWLMNLGNKGINLWAFERYLMGLNVNQAFYDLPLGTIDAKDVWFRTLFRLSGGYSSSSGIATYAFDGDTDTICLAGSLGTITADAYTPTEILTYGFLPGATGTLTLAWEYSDDGLSWTTELLVPSATYTDGFWAWFDAPAPQTAQYWRLRAVAGTLSAREVFFSTQNYDRNMTRINRDDFSNLPYKALSGLPVEYYIERLLPVPRIYIWPVPQSTFNLVVVYRTRQIQDVGALTNTIEIPDRWYMAMLSALAAQVAWEIPGLDQGKINALEAKAAADFQDPNNEERDKSPIKLIPGNRAYSR